MVVGDQIEDQEELEAHSMGKPEDKPEKEKMKHHSRWTSEDHDSEVKDGNQMDFGRYQRHKPHHTPSSHFIGRMCKSPVSDQQRKLNPAMKKEVLKEVLKLLDQNVIYPISDSKWVILVHVVPKKSGIQVVKKRDGYHLIVDWIDGLHWLQEAEQSDKEGPFLSVFHQSSTWKFG